MWNLHIKKNTVRVYWKQPKTIAKQNIEYSTTFMLNKMKYKLQTNGLNISVEICSTLLKEINRIRIILLWPRNLNFR